MVTSVPWQLRLRPPARTWTGWTPAQPDPGARPRVRREHAAAAGGVHPVRPSGPRGASGDERRGAASSGAAPAADRPGLEEAERVELTVGAVAPGGHCVARVDGPGGLRPARAARRAGGRRGDRGCTGASSAPTRSRCWTPHRTGSSRPARTRGPARCGGCDLPARRPGRPARLEGRRGARAAHPAGRAHRRSVDALGVRVEALPGGPLGWRSRVRYAVDAAGRAGLLKHRSHEVVPIDRCLIAHPAIQELPVLAPTGARWPDADAVETVASTGGDVAVVAYAERGCRRR